MKTSKTIAILICASLLLIGVIAWGRHHRNTARPAGVQTITPLGYRILQDDRGKLLKIGVECPIDEKKLEATLAKAADEHQNDANRDYLMSKYFYVEAYIVYKDHQSSVPAGIIERYVPPRNPQSHEEPLSDADKADEFEITISKATYSLTSQGVDACRP
jgi:hypothetical protein